MEQIKQLLQNSLNREFRKATLSNPRVKEQVSKIKVRPILKNETLIFQCERFQNNQAFHDNYEADEACDKLLAFMEEFKQMQLETKKWYHTVLVSKKGKVTIQKRRREISCDDMDLSHNRSKHYLLQEGNPIPFLQDLGVMTAEGKVVKSKFDKFRQINRFLEFVEDIIPELPNGRELKILDFGCGKSYLTFAMYYYLHEVKALDVKMIGLDLKKDVIIHCNELSCKYGYEKLKFAEGNIADFTGEDAVDMVVTLHACDTATDYALAKAVGWNAKVILSVPCCQHELNTQIENSTLKPMLKYGLIKERFAALATDALRAEYLVCEGYDAQILEFIEMEHTPKNILIRAVKTGKKGSNQDSIKSYEKFLNVSPTLGKLLGDKGDL